MRSGNTQKPLSWAPSKDLFLNPFHQGWKGKKKESKIKNKPQEYFKQIKGVVLFYFINLFIFGLFFQGRICGIWKFPG